MQITPSTNSSPSPSQESPSSARSNPSTEGLTGKPRVIIVGGGFGGLRVLKALNDAPVDVVLIDKRNYHLFQPLLYQVATAALNPSQIAAPLRSAVPDYPNCSVYMSEVRAIDIQNQRVLLGDEHTPLCFDYLVLAAGAQPNYFGHPEWEQFAPSLKSLDDAIRIRNRFLLAFEQAEMSRDPVVQGEALTFVVVGAGPTGVELAGAMAEISKTTLQCSFRQFDAASARIILIDGDKRVLTSFSEQCSARALADLQSLGVEVMLNTRVTEVTADSVSLLINGTERRTIRSSNVVWSAGVMANTLARTLNTTLDRTGRVKVGPDLTIAGHPNIFVIGDLAAYTDPASGEQVPGVAQGAIQMGDYVGRLLTREIRVRADHHVDTAERPPFRFRDKGSMATIGRGRAIVQIGTLRFGGLVAWLLWAFVHIFFLVGFRNRIVIMLQWVWMYFFYERGVRLITGQEEQSRSPKPPKDSRAVGSN